MCPRTLLNAVVWLTDGGKFLSAKCFLCFVFTVPVTPSCLLGYMGHIHLLLNVDFLFIDNLCLEVSLDSKCSSARVYPKILYRLTFTLDLVKCTSLFQGYFYFLQVVFI